MKSIAYVALHYGKEYLAWAIRSVQDAVEEIHILYTDRPSFGYSTPLACPDTEEELKREANRFLEKPLFWHKDHWPHEGAHRRFAVDVALERGADRLLVLDADEIWAPGVAKEALEASYSHHEKDGLAGRMIHFWRSLDHVCHDPCAPVRVINVKGNPSGTWYLPLSQPILHMGYAQSSRVTEYKTDIHGHRGEWRSEWLHEKFMAWTPGCGMQDVHPTNHQNFWHPEPVTAEEQALVKTLLHDHPYYGKAVVE